MKSFNGKWQLVGLWLASNIKCDQGMMSRTRGFSSSALCIPCPVLTKRDVRSKGSLALLNRHIVVFNGKVVLIYKN